jgi:hypothetical protein
MSKGFRLLRLEYLFTVLLPCLLAIYLNNYEIGQHIWILSGFGFYAITGNTLNDFIDMNNPDEKETLNRIKGYSHKEIATLAIGSFLLGSACFANVVLIKPLLLIYLVLIILLVVVYCLFKSLVIINHVILGISHMLLPWFMIKINAGSILFGFLPLLELPELLILLSVASVGYTGQMVHELIDGDSLSRLAPRKSQIVIWSSCIISLILSVISIILTQYLIFLPIIFFPLGIMYIFRKPRNNLLGRTSLKDIGIILGNLIFFYVIILILA